MGVSDQFTCRNKVVSVKFIYLLNNILYDMRGLSGNYAMWDDQWLRL